MGEVSNVSQVGQGCVCSKREARAALTSVAYTVCGGGAFRLYDDFETLTAGPDRPHQSTPFPKKAGADDEEAGEVRRDVGRRGFGWVYLR